MARSAIGSMLRWSGLRLFGVAATVGAVGCAGTTSAGEDIATENQAYSPSVFHGWSAGPPVNSGGFTDSPATCGIAPKNSAGTYWDGIMMVGRHNAGASINRFRFALYYKARGWLSWPDLGTMTFNSKPACSSLNDINMVGTDSTWNGRAAIFGKSSSDNKFYARIMLLNAAGQINEPPQSPTVSVDWHSVGMTAYDSAPFATVEYGYLLLGGRTSSGTINVYLNQLATDPNAARSYNKNTWRASIALSALPSGWTAVGDPAAASTGGQGLTHVVTRARNAFNQTRLYIIPLYVPFAGSNGYFLGPPSWIQVPTGTVPVSSDPALEYDYNRGELTLYFRGGAGGAANRIFQATSLNGTDWEAFTAIGTDTFTTAPAAAGTLQFDWSHAVIARKTDATQLWWNGIDPRAFDP